MSESIIQANGVDLCVETFGAAGDPAILLIHGAAASMLGWETEFCERLAAGGRYVIRFDNRDTGRSVSYPPGRPGYSLSDLVDDALGILDVLAVRRAHLVGRSMAGAIIAQAALRHADWVASLTFVTTTPGDPDLPPMSQDFLDYVGSGGPDPSDRAAVVEYVVGLLRAYSGSSPYFDAAAVRPLVERDVARTSNVASCLTNHFLIDFGGPAERGLDQIDAPTLVIHGECDPVFPLEHGHALQEAVPGAELLVMDRAGHELPRALWDVVVPALITHTADRKFPHLYSMRPTDIGA